MGGRKGTEFSLFDEPTPVKKESKSASSKGPQTERSESEYKINIAGNGMGNRAGTQFSLFDDDEQEERAPAKPSAGATARAERKAAKSFDWDF